MVVTRKAILLTPLFSMKKWIYASTVWLPLITSFFYTFRTLLIYWHIYSEVFFTTLIFKLTWNRNNCLIIVTSKSIYITLRVNDVRSMKSKYLYSILHKWILSKHITNSRIETFAYIQQLMWSCTVTWTA